MTTDPWCNNKNTEENQNNCEKDNSLEFEDNFSPVAQAENHRLPVSVLPDSESYLEILERKLKKIKRDPKILEQLAQKREECLSNLLNESINLDRYNADLDTPLGASDSTVQDIYRHICPVQPITVGEIVHIVKYDQLEEEKSESEEQLESISDTASR